MSTCVLGPLIIEISALETQSDEERAGKRERRNSARIERLHDRCCGSNEEKRSDSAHNHLLSCVERGSKRKVLNTDIPYEIYEGNEGPSLKKINTSSRSILSISQFHRCRVRRSPRVKRRRRIRDS